MLNHSPIEHDYYGRIAPLQTDKSFAKHMIEEYIEVAVKKQVEIFNVELTKITEHLREKSVNEMKTLIKEIKRLNETIQRMDVFQEMKNIKGLNKQKLLDKGKFYDRQSQSEREPPAGN